MKSFETLSNQQLFESVEKSFRIFKYMKNQGESGFADRFDKFQKVKLLMNDKK